MKPWRCSMTKKSQPLEVGPLVVGLWLLAITTTLAASTTGYLPAVGIAPLRFAPPARGSSLPLPEDRRTNVTSLATVAPVLIDVGVTNRSALLPQTPVTVPISTLPPDTSQISILRLPNPVTTVPPPVIDMSSVLSWLSPTSTNAPVGNVSLPVFVPATPPRSSKAEYESR